MKKKSPSYFWTSYADLMTSLFFVMLVLFVLTTVMLKRQSDIYEAERNATQEELDEIRKVQESTKDLSKEYFEFRPEYQKYVLKVKCFFPVRQYDINLLTDETRRQLYEAGQEIERFLYNHKSSRTNNIENKYLLIIEGQASKNSQEWTDYNYNLSFQRAYALMKFWKDVCGINFGDNCEVQITGSGDGRYNIDSMRDANEETNQRFLIHIIPKNIYENSTNK